MCISKHKDLKKKVDCLETGINEIMYTKEGGINAYPAREKSLGYIKYKTQGKENVHYSTNHLQDEGI